MTNITQSDLRKLETIGCDLGDTKSELFVIYPNEKTRELEPQGTTREAFRKFFEGRPKSHVVIEVGTHSRWVSALLKELGHIVTVANPRNVKLITKSNRKTDKADARLLARIGRADIELLSSIQHRGEQVQADLAIIKTRDALVRCRTKLINQARGLTKSFGFRLPKCDAEYFYRRTIEFVPEKLKPALLPIYEILEQLANQIKVLEKKLKELAKEKYPDVEVVGQIKGVGVLTALAFLLILEDKNRFQKSRDIGAFIGLTPKIKESGENNPQLRITKEGDQLLRRLLVQSAHYILGPFGIDSDLRRWGLELCKRGGKAAKKRARIAVARKLSVLMHRLWITGEIYEPIGYEQKRRPNRIMEALA
jgi:transposase